MVEWVVGILEDSVRACVIMGIKMRAGSKHK